MQEADDMPRGLGDGPVPSPSTSPVGKAASDLGRLPTLPEVATKALAVANDRNCTLVDFASLIEKDTVLATGVLRLANSSLFRVGRELASLHQAVLRLGLRRCKNLLIAVGMRSLFRKMTPIQKAYCERLWDHSFLTACLCRRLSASLEFAYQGEEFACGLCHDLGRILFVLAAPDTVSLVPVNSFQEDEAMLQWERSVFGNDHCSFGAWYAHRSQLPGAVVAAIQHHHSTSKAPVHQVLVGLTAVAEQIANNLAVDGSPESYDLKANEPWRFLGRHSGEDLRIKLEKNIGSTILDALAEAKEVEVLRAA